MGQGCSGLGQYKDCPLDGKSFIIPIILPPPTHQTQTALLLQMSFKHVADFQEFMLQGREGSYSLNKENQGLIVVFWLKVPADTIVIVFRPRGEPQGEGLCPKHRGSYNVRYPRSTGPVGKTLQQL